MIETVAIVASLLFTVSLHCDWMDRQIQADFAGITQISPTQIDATEKAFKEMGRAYVRVKTHGKIIDYSTPVFSHPVYQTRTDFFIDFFNQMKEVYSLPPVDFIISLDDACPTLPVQGAPAFCITKEKGRNGVILIPEVWTCRDGFYEKIEQAGAEFPWSNKIPIAFWRGSTTGGFYDAETWGKIPRTQLVLFSKSYPNHLDCAFHHFVQGDQEAEMLLQNARLMGIGCDPILQVRYKYLIAIDGNTNPSSLKWQLFSGSPVLKNDTVCDEWYSNALVPYEHYIPYKMDFSDLIEQIDWLRQNDEMAKYIAEQARIFANQHLKSDQYQLYTYKALLAYSKLLRNY